MSIVIELHVFPVSEQDYHELDLPVNKQCACEPVPLWSLKNQCWALVHKLMLNEEVINKLDDQIDEALNKNKNE